MGNKSSHSQYPVEQKPEIRVNSYQSKNDSLFTKFEKELNFLRLLEIKDFQQILYNFACTKQEEESSNRREKEFNYEITDTLFSVFVDKKIINHFLVYPQISANDKNINIVKQFYCHVFKFLEKDFKHYNKKISDHTVEITNKGAIRKICLLAFAFLYCKNDYFDKFMFLFNILSDEVGEIIKSNDLVDFFFYLFVIPSNVLIISIFTLGTEFEDFAIEEDKFKEVYDSYEVKDSKALVDKFINDMFADGEALNQDKFYKVVLANDWIFTPSGIRKQLEDNNNQ